jgi:signal transduction histidine kinase
MEGARRHRRILILMITSQLLLTFFVLQWLRSQYRNEKELLVRELTGLYIDTQDEIIDTLLFRSYVNPVLAQNRHLQNQYFIGVNDSVFADSVILSKPGQAEGAFKWNGPRGAITVRVEHGQDSAMQMPDTIKIRRMNDDMLLRSVKLIVSHTKDSTNSEKPVTINFKMKPDTSIFKRHYHEKVSGAGMKVKLIWDENGTPVNENRMTRALEINFMNPFGLPGVLVTEYNWFIAGKIVPQILFGLVLIFITALAFMLSYRSIREHVILNSLRNEFISNITHELKTPVATLSVALESLGKFNMRNDPSAMDEYLRLASLETKRLEELINRVLDQSLLEENTQMLDLSVININPVISEAADIMQQRLSGAGKIEFLPSDGKINVLADPLFLKGVIINLIDNSIKYCDKTPFIRILTKIETQLAVIEVNDNGPGIPVEYQRKVFEKFFRLPSANVHNVKGYGLGLSFASLVMKLHKGSIEVLNSGQGCSFILKIPVA